MTASSSVMPLVAVVLDDQMHVRVGEVRACDEHPVRVDRVLTDRRAEPCRLEELRGANLPPAVGRSELVTVEQ